MKDKPVLIIAILMKSRGAIGGMAQRFCFVGNEFINRNCRVELLTTQSLLKALKLKKRKHIHALDDYEGNISWSSLLKIFYIVIKVLFSRYSQVHISGAGRLLPVIVWASKWSNTKLSCTFASRTLQMASYGRAEDEARWVSLLNAVDMIDVLNPSHNLSRWGSKIKISPCSFPSNTTCLPESFSHRRKPVAIFCGALEKNKNPILAIEIVEEYLNVNDVELEMLIFGKGPLLERVEQKAFSINARHNREVIRFCDYGELAQSLSTANFFFSLQEVDNYPSQSLMEAMLLGCKVIATDEGDTHMMLPRNAAGNAIINSRSPVCYVDAVKNALAQPVACYENVAHIHANHSLDNFVKYFSEFASIKL